MTDKGEEREVLKVQREEHKPGRIRDTSVVEATDEGRTKKGGQRVTFRLCQ